MMGSPGRVPPAIATTAGERPPLETWDPNGDILLPDNGAEITYAPPIAIAPPMLPRPEQHPQRQDFPARGYERCFTVSPAVIARQLAFTAQSVRVDNFSSHWLFFQAAGQFVPPYTYGVVLLLSPGVGVAQFAYAPPQGLADASPTIDSNVVTVWYETEYAPNAGTILPASFRGGAAGGVVTLNSGLNFSPDNTYDIGGGGLRPHNVNLAGNVALAGGAITGFTQLAMAGGGPTQWGGNVPPAAGLGNNGDIFWNTTGGAGTTIYQKRAGAWVGIV
jgi:hypothetical protein